MSALIDRGCRATTSNAFRRRIIETGFFGVEPLPANTRVDANLLSVRAGPNRAFGPSDFWLVALGWVITSLSNTRIVSQGKLVKFVSFVKSMLWLEDRKFGCDRVLLWERSRLSNGSLDKLDVASSEYHIKAAALYAVSPLSTC